METINTKEYTNDLVSNYDREKEVKAFDNTKTGVKGVVDSGAKTLPKIFVRPSNELLVELNSPCVTTSQGPVIDFEGIERKDRRDEIVKQVLSASEKWGFFQVVNHGIPLQKLDELLKGCRLFHEQDAEAKKEFYGRDVRKPVVYTSDDDLYRSRSADWRDILAVNREFQPKDLPDICRDVIVDYLNHILKLGDTLLELLSEALGLEPSFLKDETECNKEWYFANNYYPPCPAPELTMGFHNHTDASFLTMLLQDQIGGLQLLYENQWVDILPVPGAIAVNIGDFLQILSNDRFKSSYHRATANRVGPRLSAAVFLLGALSTPKLYGPIKKLLSNVHPPVYEEFTISDYHAKVFKGPSNKHGPDYVKVGSHGGASM